MLLLFYVSYKVRRNYWGVSSGGGVVNWAPRSGLSVWYGEFLTLPSPVPFLPPPPISPPIFEAYAKSIFKAHNEFRTSMITATAQHTIVRPLSQLWKFRPRKLCGFPWRGKSFSRIHFWDKMPYFDFCHKYPDIWKALMIDKNAWIIASRK